MYQFKNALQQRLSVSYFFKADGEENSFQIFWSDSAD